MVEPNNEDDLIELSGNSNSLGQNVRSNMGKAVNRAAKEVSKKATKNAASAVAKKSLLAAFAPALTIAAIIIVAIVITVGIAVFLNTLPGLSMDKLKALGKKMANGLASWFGADSTKQVDDEVIFDTLTYLEQVGYDLKGYGFITDYKGAGDVGSGQYLDEDAGVVRDEETDEIKDAKSDFIMAYLISDNYIYTIANHNLVTEEGEGPWDWLKGKAEAIGRHIVDFFGGSLGAHWTAGLLTFWEEDGSIGHRGSYYSDTNFGDMDDIHLDVEKGELIVKRGGGSAFKYKLDGWTGRYGMPMEFLLSIHLATMMPDLAYDMANSFETKVNIILHPTSGAYAPYVENVIDHWYRNVYYTNVGYNANNDPDGKVDFIDYDYEYEDVMRERWTLYETDEDGEYVLYVLSDIGNGSYATKSSDIDGYSSSKIESKDGNYIYKGTREEAIEENVAVSKKAVTLSGRADREHKSLEDILENDIEWQNSSGIYTAYKEVGGGVLQKGDALRGETNPKIKKMFLQNTYFSYDGTQERAEAIKKFRQQYGVGYGSLNSSGLNPDKVDLSTKMVTVNTDSGSNTYKASDVTGKVNLNQDSLNAFSMLENTQTLDADYIYRDFKELIVELGYFEKEEVTDETPRLLAWIIPEIGSYGFPKRELDKIENEFGTLAHSKLDYIARDNAVYWKYNGSDSKNIPDEGGSSDAQTTEMTEEEKEAGGRGNDTTSSEDPIANGTKTNTNTPVLPGSPCDRVVGTMADAIQSVSGKKRYLFSGGASITNDFLENEMEDVDAVVRGRAASFNYSTSFSAYSDESSYIEWLESLGGVFSDYAGEKVQGEGDGDSFVDAQKYCYGLMWMAGFEYCAGTCLKPSGDPASKGGRDRCTPILDIPASDNIYDAYHNAPGISFSHRDLGAGTSVRTNGQCAPVHIDKAMVAHNFTTNCNHTTDKVYYKAGLFGDGSDNRPHASDDYIGLVEKYGAKIVIDPKDLHMGDLIECFDEGSPYTNPNPHSWTGWHHVFYVGNEDEEYLHLYTTGHDFIKDGNFVRKVPRDCSRGTVYGGGWVGLHLWDLKLNDEKYEGYKGNEAVVSPVTGILLDYGTYAESDDERINVDILYDNYISEMEAEGLDLKYAIPRQEYKEQVGYAKIMVLDAKNYKKLESSIDNRWRNDSLLETSANGKNFKFRDVLKEKDDFKNWSMKDKTVYGYKEFVEKYEKYGIAGNIIYIDGFKCEYVEKGFHDGDGKYPEGEKIDKSNFDVSPDNLDSDENRKKTKYKKDKKYHTVSKEYEDQINAEATIKKKAAPAIGTNGLIFIKEGTILGRTVTDRELIEKDRHGELGSYDELRKVGEDVTTDYKVIGNYIRMIMRDKSTDTVVENIEDYMKLDDGIKDEKERELRIMGDFDVTDETNFVTLEEFLQMFAGWDVIIRYAQNFIDMQEKYGINAAFAACVTIVESSGGTNGALVSGGADGPHNWFSITGSYNGDFVYISGNPRKFRKYPDFSNAVDDFGDLIKNSSYYVCAGRHTVNQIGPTYCNSGWSEKVNGFLKDAYSKVVDSSEGEE